MIGERSRTAGGKLRQDFIAMKRIWKLKTRPMTKAQANVLIDYLNTNDWQVGNFWLDEIGSNIQAFVMIDSENRVQFYDGPTFVPDGRELELTIEEQ
jgi:hypothetical protein